MHQETESEGFSATEVSKQESHNPNIVCSDFKDYMALSDLTQHLNSCILFFYYIAFFFY